MDNVHAAYKWLINNLCENEIDKANNDYVEKQKLLTSEDDMKEAQERAGSLENGERRYGEIKEDINLTAHKCLKI